MRRCGEVTVALRVGDGGDIVLRCEVCVRDEVARVAVVVVSVEREGNRGGRCGAGALRERGRGADEVNVWLLQYQPGCDVGEIERFTLHVDERGEAVGVRGGGMQERRAGDGRKVGTAVGCADERLNSGSGRGRGEVKAEVGESVGRE